MEMDWSLRSTYLDDGQGPPPSEMDIQLQKILHKQMDTHVTLTSQFERHRDFRPGGELTSLPPSSAGLRSAQQIQSMEEETENVTRLFKAGMNAPDIALYLQAKNNPTQAMKPSCSKRLCEPSAFEKRFEELKGQVDRCTESLQETPLKPALEDPFTYIARFAQKLEAKRKRKKPKRPPAASDLGQNESREVTRDVDPSEWHAVVPLQEEDILANRLSEQEIKRIPKFANYSPGEPNSVLFLKNLHTKVTLHELIAIFGRYDAPGARVKYRTMTGRMRRQAFVSFKDLETATEAMALTNGYKLRGQPMLITYAQRRQNTC